MGRKCRNSFFKKKSKWYEEGLRAAIKIGYKIFKKEEGRALLAVEESVAYLEDNIYLMQAEVRLYNKVK